MAWGKFNLQKLRDEKGEVLYERAAPHWRDFPSFILQDKDNSGRLFCITSKATGLRFYFEEVEDGFIISSGTGDHVNNSRFVSTQRHHLKLEIDPEA